jgi:hypothetical protein
MVEEGVAGHGPMTGRGEGSAPWIWGQTLDEAREVCDRFNQERLGISPDEASDIVLSSMGAQNREASSMTTFYLNINTDNDAFRPDPEMELARIFRVLSDQLEHGEIPATVPDINGNTVGYIHRLKNGIVLNHVTTDA